MLHRGKRPLHHDDLAWLRAYVFRLGEALAIEQLGLSRVTIARGMAGLDLHPATRAAIRSARLRAAEAA